ncbi:hypothetical protein WA026_005308 [Henosepilachna vigintioctopunctata]|uniref:Uncharacterized protein n=1 Tax=Henosepilachna vigintioctopunctata TaxID=420089 RepID=A0AAW1UMQ5_9CUCU
MYSLKFIILLITVVVILEAKEKMKQNRGIFKKCAEANGLDRKKMEGMKVNESEKKSENQVNPLKEHQKNFYAHTNVFGKKKAFYQRQLLI